MSLSEEAGFPFTAEEFQAARAETLDAELSEEQLENVAGGNAEKAWRDFNRFLESASFGLAGANCPIYRD